MNKLMRSNTAHTIIFEVFAGNTGCSARMASMSLAGGVSTEPRRKAPYLCDLQWRVVWLRISQDLTFREIGQRLCIAPSTAHAVFTRFEETGEVDPLKQPLTDYMRDLNLRSNHMRRN